MSGAFTRNRRAQTSAPPTQSTCVLNAYEITNPEHLKWEVVRYHVDILDGDPVDEDRGLLKDRIWNLRKAHPSTAPGLGFVLNDRRDTVLVPQHWHLPNQSAFDGYRIARGAEFTLHAHDRQYSHAVRELLATGIARHLRVASVELGQVWRHGRGFCEIPRAHPDDPTVHYARRFEVQPAIVKGHRWVMQVHLSTTSVDARTIADYCLAGELAEFSERVVLKRVNRSTRQMESTAVRVLVQQGGKAAERMNLLNPELLMQKAQLPSQSQRATADQSLLCERFNGEQVTISSAEARLILDTQITQAAHRETILSVPERTQLIRKVRDAVNGFEAAGVPVSLASSLYEIPPKSRRVVPLPPLHVRGTNESPGFIAGATDEHAIHERARARKRALQERGYVVSRPLIPLLAVPTSWSVPRTRRLQVDLNELAQRLNLNFEFSVMSYKDPDEIQKVCAQGRHNALIAVLPEGTTTPQRDGDTHDQIKRQVGVPSQCIQTDNTLPERFIRTRPGELPQHLGRAVQGRYRLILENLVVKAGWIPYTTASASAFNVQIGIDVGGLRNNYAMACLGYGLATPGAQPIYLPLSIEVDCPQVEPIPDSALCESLDQGLQRVAGALEHPDFSRVLFLRDGDMNGQGLVWQEIDGLKALKQRWVQSGRVPADAQWVVVELSKRAEHWRQFRRHAQEIHNPTVGTVTFPFDQPNQALLSTTGAPYLTHGTADPLFATVTPLDCECDMWEVMQDLVWSADLSFTNPSLGTSLPWPLYVADRAARAVSEGHLPNTGLLV